MLNMVSDFAQFTLLGSRSSILSCDIQTLSSRPYARKCVLMKLADASMYSLRKAIENNAGGFVIMLPLGNWDDASLSVCICCFYLLQ